MALETVEKTGRVGKGNQLDAKVRGGMGKVSKVPSLLRRCFSSELSLDRKSKKRRNTHQRSDPRNREQQFCEGIVRYGRSSFGRSLGGGFNCLRREIAEKTEKSWDGKKRNRCLQSCQCRRFGGYESLLMRSGEGNRGEPKSGRGKTNGKKGDEGQARGGNGILCGGLEMLANKRGRGKTPKQRAKTTTGVEKIKKCSLFWGGGRSSQTRKSDRREKRKKRRGK